MSVQFISGIIDIAFGIFHVFFWKLFDWPDSLAPSGRINEGVTQILNIMLSYVFFVAGCALIAGGEASGDQVALAASGFWLIRLGLQPVFFDWRDQRSIALMILFATAFVSHVAIVVR